VKWFRCSRPKLRGNRTRTVFTGLVNGPDGDSGAHGVSLWGVLKREGLTGKRESLNGRKSILEGGKNRSNLLCDVGVQILGAGARDR